MTAPPGHAPITPLFGEQITDARDSDLGTRNAQLRFLMRELGWKRADCQRLIHAFEFEQSERRAHAEAREAGGFDDVREVVRETFRAWFTRRGDIVSMPSKPRASAPGWRTASS